MNENRGRWYLITGLVLGAVAGLLFAWLVRPVEYTNTSPASLRADFKDQYRALIAAAYSANGDLLRARARLDLLQDADLYRTLAEQAQRSLATGASIQEARALGQLAVALGQPPATLPITPDSATATHPEPDAATSTSAAPAGSLTSADTTAAPGVTTTTSPSRTPRPSATATATGTPLPSRTPTATPGAPFVLESQELICEPGLVEPVIQVWAFDAAGQGVPGIEVVVSWDSGENHFFTGLKPEISLGYADFTMAADIVYTLRLAEGGLPVPDLKVVECENDNGERQPGSWKLVFTQP